MGDERRRLGDKKREKERINVYHIVMGKNTRKRKRERDKRKK